MELRTFLNLFVLYKPNPHDLAVCVSCHYFNLEHYSNEPTQSYIKFPSKEAWLNGFLGATLSNCQRASQPIADLSPTSPTLPATQT
jgi:hypothetical protein